MTTAPAPAGVDRRAVVRAAAIVVAIVLPVRLVVRALTGGDESNLDLLVVLVFFIAFVSGGVVAARSSRAAPFINAAAAALLAYCAMVFLSVLARLVRGDGLGVAFLVTFLLFGQIAVALAIIGAFFTRRRAVEDAA